MWSSVPPQCVYAGGAGGINTVLNHPLTAHLPFNNATPPPQSISSCPLSRAPCTDCPLNDISPPFSLAPLPYPQLSPRRLPHQGLLNALLLRCRSVRCLPMAVHRAGAYRPGQLRQYGFGATDPVTEGKRGG